MPASDSLERTLACRSGLSEARYAALVDLCRLLARQIDDAGDDAPTRLTAAYLSSLKDLQRVIAATTMPRRPSKLAEMRQQRDAQRVS